MYFDRIYNQQEPKERGHNIKHYKYFNSFGTHMVSGSTDIYGKPVSVKSVRILCHTGDDVEKCNWSCFIFFFFILFHNAEF